MQSRFGLSDISISHGRLGAMHCNIFLFILGLWGSGIEEKEYSLCNILSAIVSTLKAGLIHLRKKINIFLNLSCIIHIIHNNNENRVSLKSIY